MVRYAIGNVPTGNQNEIGVKRVIFDPSVFGQGFHRFVEQEYRLFGSVLAPLLHIGAAAVVLLAVIFGNRVRRVVSGYFTLNWLFLFSYWGIYAVVYWTRIGIVYLLTYLPAPILLALIAAAWIRELFQNKIDLDFRHISPVRWAVLPIILWGFWYPTYLYGQGFLFLAKDLISSCFGLMPCPTTMVVLGMFCLTYPCGNKTLFSLMTVYALLIGTATVATGWLPDIPFIMIGLYAAILAAMWKKKEKRLAAQ